MSESTSTVTGQSGERALIGTVGPAAGVAMQVVLATTVIGGALRSTVFSWPADPFSIVGSTGGTVATAFNAGVITAGLLALPVAAWLWRARRPSIGALYGLFGASLSLAGAFPIPSPLHDLAAGIFLFGPALLLVAGVDHWRSGAKRAAAVEGALGAASLGVWLPYDLGWTGAQIGYAACEAVALGAVGVWTLWTVSRRR